MNLLDTEKYKTHSCSALCPVELHTRGFSGVLGMVFFMKSLRTPAHTRPVKNGAKPDTGRSPFLATFQNHASASNDGYQIVCLGILSFLT